MKLRAEIAVVLEHAFAAWLISAAAMTVALWKAHAMNAAFSTHALVVALSFVLVSFAYFQRRAPLAPSLAGLVAGSLVIAMDTSVALAFGRGFDVRGAALGVWLPGFAALLATWITGLAMTAMRPLHHEA